MNIHNLEELDLLLADGFDEALIGYTEDSGEIKAVYDYDKIIEILIQRDDMEAEDAREYADFNIKGAYVGPKTPIFMYPFAKKSN
jgi:hypothetical protein